MASALSRKRGERINLRFRNRWFLVALQCPALLLCVVLLVTFTTRTPTKFPQSYDSKNVGNQTQHSESSLLLRPSKKKKQTADDDNKISIRSVEEKEKTRGVDKMAGTSLELESVTKGFAPLFNPESEVEIEETVAQLAQQHPSCEKRKRALNLFFQKKSIRLRTHEIDGFCIRLPKTKAEAEETVAQFVRDHSSCRDKESFLRTVFAAGDSRFALKDLDGEELCNALPSQTAVNEMYGPEAVIYGMETCKAYQELLKPENNNGETILPKPRVAGLYHTGTNALARSFKSNLFSGSAGTPVRSKHKLSSYEVPWGKHLPPAAHRLSNLSPPDNKENALLVLPIVIIRDPFFWMQSMCKQGYDARWEKPSNNRCPNLIRFAHNQTTYAISAQTHQTNYKKIDNYTSLVDMWSDWYSQYLNADYPRLIIRFEDTLYRLEEVVKKVHECVGVNQTGDKPFQYHITISKHHGMPTEFVGGLQKYASAKNRHRGLNEVDRKYAQSVLNSELLRIFNYKQAPLSVPPADLEEPFLVGKVNSEPIVENRIGFQHVLNQREALKKKKALENRLEG